MAPSLEERQKTLKLKREAFKLELETFQLLIDSTEAGDSGSQIQVHFDDLESEYMSFNKAQAELDSADTTGELMRERIALKSAFITCKARAMDILNKLKHSQQTGSALGVESLSLRASPQSAMESIDKDGEAAKAIESVGNSAANYRVAWGLLEKRYNQPATIVTNHLRAIVDVPLLQKPSYQDFRTFLNSMEAHYRALQALQQPSADTVLVHLIVSKLDEESALKQTLKIPVGIHLADPDFHMTGNIDGILGGQFFWDLMCIGRIVLANQCTKLQKTQLGWIVVGHVPDQPSTQSATCNLTLSDLQSDMHKFWNLEECPSVKLLSPEEQACETHYTSNTIRDAVTGRYTVGLPFNDQKEKLGESRQIAVNRFLSLERSLNKRHAIKVQYVEFLKEYERLGHMTEVTDESTEGIYLPHHPVVKDSSLTTKVRVVFDASARSSSGVSLNETLMVGPTIQDDLVSIITRFRLHKYVLTADIAKMYRQVDLRAVDRKYQRILWRENSNQPIKTYELNTVTYGTASAPFLAVRTLHQLAHDEIGNHPIAASAFLRDFYVDDVLTGADSFDEAMLLRNELIRLAAKGGFQLRQWVSNEPRLLESFLDASVHDHMVLDASDDKKTLGLYWKAERDVLGYTIKQVEPLQKVTKRTILSRIAQLFDPLGLLGPVIVQAKILMQNLWKCNLDWDESVPVDIYGAWVNFQSQLPLIQSVHIPRRVISDGHTHLQLHGFCDASEQAYGACIYIRSTRDGQGYSAQLVSSKSKVAPLKTQSLPRLELCGAVLLIKLYNIIIKAINLSFEKVVFWSDSTITLQWIRTAPHTLKTFVANRVSLIQQHSAPSQWLHVPSEHNAADILSRGSNIQDFLMATSWFTGPRWLSQSEDTWPHYDMQPIDIPEKRKVVVLHATTNAEVQLLEKFSSFILLQRVIAYCLRFYYNVCHKPKRGGPLTTNELTQAHFRIIRLLQRLVFTKEIHDLSNSEITKCGTRFTALGPFLDEDGLLRVGGRLKHALLPYSVKHPLLLPQNHFLTELIIREIHVKHGHIGARGTLHAVRQKYWPVNGMITVKSVLRKCITCHKLTAIVPQYPIGQLPRDRVVLNRPFLVTGVDYCGPFLIKEKKLRNTKKVKTYVAVFVCFSTKAVHLELVSDMTSDAFLAALKRFFARRGKCTDLYSDNGTNFIGASRELQRIHNAILVQDPKDHFQKYLSEQNVRWHFIPPRAPHFGGLWEAAVRSMKHHLMRIVGNAVLTFEGFTTCLAEIEAILNSRPLTPLSSDPNDLSPLTPGHFLIGDSLTSTPECDLTSVKTGRLSSWQHIQQLRQHFWSRWYKEYLNELIVRKKWHDGRTTQITEGMLVVLKEDNTPPLCWPMGRIVATHPGEDGVVRVATVRTLTGDYKRSVKRLSPLPVNDD
ncbi:uncharacterized protein LOC143374185 [Andrena cerasifolii]|uniref:uncharacterized protein LOC143374185 n=1 Tax=Andrena cerasifolii TaxID=2819439 RepID=UPI004037CC9A